MINLKRLEALSLKSGIKVTAWHGDVNTRPKRFLRRKPEGILMITPESLESQFINHRRWLLPMFMGLKFIVIDELHAFFDSERGIHLQSLLSRLFQAIGHRPRVFALSATISNLDYAKIFINPFAPSRVVVVPEPRTRRSEFSLRVVAPDESGPAPIEHLAQELKAEFEKSSNLIFVNNRKMAEVLANSLHSASHDKAWDQSSFLLHHGSLSKDVRHCTELRLKNQPQTNVICTSSLELGIDIGSIDSVAQINPPWSVASLVQRLGRSGRTEEKSGRLVLYILQAPTKAAAPLDDLLFPPCFKA